MPYWRVMALRQKKKFCGRYVAVTGSCGKSTTTSVIAHIAAQQRSTRLGHLHNTERNVWRSLRKLRAPVDLMVQEVSEFPPGALQKLGADLEPDAAIVTSVGLDHYVSFRTEEKVAAEMAELVASVRADGVVCLNADDPFCAGLAGRSRARVVLFGQSASADVRISGVQSALPGRLSFEVAIGGRSWTVRTRFVGTMMLTNLAGALAMADALGLDMDKAVAALGELEPLPGRMQVVESAAHSYVFDTVKAPLWSTRLLVDDLPNMSPGRRILVLGNLSDVGGDSSSKLRRMLRMSAERADLVIGLHRAGEQIARVKSNYPDLNVEAARSAEHLVEILRAQPPSLVVIKGNDMKLGPAELLAPAAQSGGE